MVILNEHLNCMCLMFHNLFRFFSRKITSKLWKFYRMEWDAFDLPVQCIKVKLCLFVRTAISGFDVYPFLHVTDLSDELLLAL